MSGNTEWQVSGNAAERYEEHLVPVIFVPWSEELLSRTGGVAGKDVLDVACGTGIVARRAASKGARATGSDINAGMLAVARRLAAGEGLSIDWVEASADAMPLPDGGFDALLCQQGFQFFPDKPAAAREMLRVLRPGGCAVLCVAGEIGRNPLMRTQVDALTRHLGADAAQSIRAVCQMPDGAEIGRVFREAGFADVSVETVALMLRHPDAAVFVLGLLSASPLADRIAQLPQAQRSALLADALAGFGDCVQGDGSLTFPHVSNVIVARR